MSTRLREVLHRLLLGIVLAVLIAVVTLGWSVALTLMVRGLVG